MKKTMILIATLLLLTYVCKGMEAGSSFSPYRDAMEDASMTYIYEGPFVLVPAALGEYSFAIVGLILIAPGEIGYSVATNKPPQVIGGMKLSYTYVAPWGRMILGLPFYIVKKLLWDAPVYLYEAVAGEDEKVASQEAKEKKEDK